MESFEDLIALHRHFHGRSVVHTFLTLSYAASSWTTLRTDASEMKSSYNDTRGVPHTSTDVLKAPRFISSVCQVSLQE